MVDHGGLFGLAPNWMARAGTPPSGRCRVGEAIRHRQARRRHPPSWVNTTDASEQRRRFPVARRWDVAWLGRAGGGRCGGGGSSVRGQLAGKQEKEGGADDGDVLLMARSQSRVSECGGKGGVGVAVWICACAYLVLRNNCGLVELPRNPETAPGSSMIGPRCEHFWRENLTVP